MAPNERRGRTRSRSRSRSGTISPAPPPTSKRVNRAYTPSPDRNVKPRTEQQQPSSANDNGRERERERDGTPPRRVSRARSITPPRPSARQPADRDRRRSRSRSPPARRPNGPDDRWAASPGINTNIGPPRAGRSPSPLPPRTRAASPPNEPLYSLILPLPHSRIPSLLIGLKGASARSMQTYAGLQRLTFRGAGTGKGSNGNDPPIAELRGSRRAIEDGLWAIGRKGASHNQRIDVTLREDQMIRIGGGSGAPSERAPPPARRDEPRREEPRRDDRDRAPPPRRDDTWASSNGDRDRDRNGRDAPPARRDPIDDRPPVAAAPVRNGQQPLGTSDYTLEIPSLALSALYSHLPKLRSSAGIDKITLKQGQSSYIYIWGTKPAQEGVMARVDELIKGVFPSWRDAAQRAESGPGWNRDEQPVRVEIARAGPIPDRARRDRSPPPAAAQGARRRSSPPPSARGRSGTPPPRRDSRPQIPTRERETSPDPRAVGRYVAGLSEERRDEWTAAFVQASGLPHAEVKQDENGDVKMEA